MNETVAGLVDEVTATLGNSAEARELVSAVFDAPRSWTVLHADDAFWRSFNALSEIR